MLLKNYYKAITPWMANNYLEVEYVNVLGNKVQTNDAKTPMTNMTPTLSNSSYCAHMGRMVTTFGSSTCGIVIGTGDTPPTIDDYKLSGELITTFTGSVSPVAKITDNGVSIESLCTITNTGNEAFTIKEIALYGKSASGASNNYSVLVDRTILDSPVTIEPGGVGQVTYTIEFKYPTA